MGGGILDLVNGHYFERKSEPRKRLPVTESVSHRETTVVLVLVLVITRTLVLVQAQTSSAGYCSSTVAKSDERGLSSHQIPQHKGT
jgi:hypothetical protein